MNSAQWTDADTVALISLQTVLGESPEQARKLAINWKRLQIQAEKHWLVAASKTSQAAMDQMAALDISDLDKLQLYFKQNPRGIILCSIHMGNYLLAALVIVVRLSAKRVSIVRRKRQSDMETQVFSKLHSLGVDYEVLRTGDRSTALRVLRRLKKGEIVIMLYDLPSRYGSTSEITLLGHKMHWVNGPILLAAKTQACLVPFICYTNEKKENCCDLQPIISFSSSALNSELQLAHQQLVRFAECYIKVYPSQWNHWDLIPEMLATPV